MGHGSLFQIIKNFYNISDHILYVTTPPVRYLKLISSGQINFKSYSFAIVERYLISDSASNFLYPYPSRQQVLLIFPTKYFNPIHYSLSLPYYSIIAHLGNHSSLLTGFLASMFLSAPIYLILICLQHNSTSHSLDGFKNYRLLGHPQAYLIIISGGGVQASITL